jgi:hypothetical protein
VIGSATDHLVRTRVRERLQVRRQRVGRHRLDVLVVVPHSRVLDRDEHARAPLQRRRVASRPLCGRVDAGVLGGEALHRVAVAREPRVPAVDVREADREHPRRVRAEHQLRRRGRLRQEERVVDVVVAAVERDVLAGEQSADDRERLLEPRDEVVERQPERAELHLVPAAAEAEDEPTAGELVRRGRHAREQARWVERGAGDERAELDALGDPREPGERRPGIPRAADRVAVEQMVADPHRVEADLFRRARHRRQLVPARLVLDLGQLNPDLRCPPLRQAYAAQNPSNAGGSEGMATIRCQTPSTWSINSTWSMSSSRPSRFPWAR